MARFREFVNCYLDAWRKYVSFSGRASRKDYWGFVLINILVSFVIAIFEVIVGIGDGFISSLYTLAVVLPNIALYTRRLHDVGRSGWWQLAVIVPLLNLYLFYMIWIKPGTIGENKFGAPAAAAQAVYSVPVANEFSGYEMCPAPKAENEPEPVQSAEPALDAAKCAACGAVLEPNAKFCSECGSPCK